MLVTVTGGTGFVGAHSIAAITGRGHHVRMMVRDKSRVRRALAPLGVNPAAVDVVIGDVTDAASVARAMDGADAVLHAAAVYSFDGRDRARTRRVNARGAAVVLEAAVRAGAGRIVHVSTVGALLPSYRPLDARSPIGRPREAYLRSKAAAEAVARGWQDHGAPVAISYPPALLGPNDPNLGDQTARLRALLRGLMPVWPRGGFPVGDVRDTARMHAALLDEPPGRPPDPAGRRVFGPSRYLTTRGYLAAAREATGRALPALFLPARAMLPGALAVNAVQRAWPWHIPAEYGAVYTCACAGRVAASADACGLEPRPLAETFADTIRWLHARGLLSEQQAGLLAEPEATPPVRARVPERRRR